MPKKKSSNSAQDLRNAAIMAAAAGGSTQSEIAKEFNLGRQQVNRILNSDQAKELTDQARSRLQEIASLAVQTLEDAMLDRVSNMGVAVKAATDVLKGLGVLTDKVKVEGDFKPFVLRLPHSGEEIHMGYRRENGEDDGEEK